jgi:hypothetical protein
MPWEVLDNGLGGSSNMHDGIDAWIDEDEAHDMSSVLDLRNEIYHLTGNYK